VSDRLIDARSPSNSARSRREQFLPHRFGETQLLDSCRESNSTYVNCYNNHNQCLVLN
jgi:hypothetical protein